MNQQLQFGLVPPLNVAMLILAREARGLTQKDLANRIGCNQSRLSKMESGELMPQESDIEHFVRILGQDRGFFFQQDATVPASVSFYRKAQTLPLKMLRQCNAQMNVQRLQFERQIGDKKLGKRELPRLSPQKETGAKGVAREVRKQWELGHGPLHGLTSLVEDAGCVVVNFPFPAAKLDGLSIHAPQKTPFIFLNATLAKSRRRMSLAHELGHLIMHTDPHEDVEREAWDFAQEFLMPTSEIEKHLVNLNLDKLGRLKMEWGISMQAILYLARKLERISENQCRFLWIQIGKCGYRVNEPFEDSIPDEIPTDLNKRLMIKN